MTTAQIIGQILGLVVVLACIITPQFPKRWQILVGSSLANLCSGFNLLLVGAGVSACLLCIVATVHCAFNAIKAKKDLPSSLGENIFFSILYFIGWGVGFLISLTQGSASPLDLIPLFGTVFFVLCVFSHKEKTMRLFSLCNALIYMIYDIIIPNTAVIAQAFTVISICIALFRYKEGKTTANQSQSTDETHETETN